MNIANFADLLQAARQQPDPQRLLFVFTQPELPPEHTLAEARRFKSGKGGVLTPKMVTDKAVDELRDFAELTEESRRTGQDWKIVFVAGMGGQGGVAPSSDDAQEPLKRMVASIQNGMVESYLAFDCKGNLVRFS
jgi:hypothetical protein